MTSSHARARRRHGRARAARRGQLPHRRAARHPGDHGGRPAAGRDRRLGPGPRGRQRAARRCTTGSVDFAAWCSYKYLNAGPGAVAGGVRPRAAPRRRDAAALRGLVEQRPGDPLRDGAESRPPASADAWQVSNPPILAMGPVRTSLELFDKVGMRRPARTQRAADRLPGGAARRRRSPAADRS